MTIKANWIMDWTRDVDCDGHQMYLYRLYSTPSFKFTLCIGEKKPRWITPGLDED